MKKFTVHMILGFLFVFNSYAHALTISITPATTPKIQGDMLGFQVGPGDSDIRAVIEPYMGLGVAAYKMDVGATDDIGSFAASYSTTFSNTSLDPANALITYTGGAFLSGEKYLFVKDGNRAPMWYLFDLTTIWNGTDSLDLSGFWPSQGAISHVSLYGESAPVPEPATIVLLGAGLLGIGLYGRKRSKM